MQAIVTRFLGPTERTGARIIATCDAGRIVRPYMYASTREDNHVSAARALAQKLGWTSEFYGRIVSGELPGSKGYVHVFTLRQCAGFMNEPEPVEGQE